MLVSGRHKVASIESTGALLPRRLRDLIALAEARARTAPKEERYNYVILKSLLRDVLKYVLAKRRICVKSTYILPGALWIAKSLLRGRLTVDEAASYIGRVRHLARKLMRELAYGKNLELIIPSNLSPEDVKVYAWADKVGYDGDGNPLYVITMYFSFPFDINELDQRSEYEPVSFLFVKRGRKYVPVKAYARVHYDLYVYDIENAENVAILFLRYGHTPKILATKVARVATENPPKELADIAWLYIGEALTKLLGTRRISLKGNKEKIHVYVKYSLPKTVNNPFVAPIHPYFIDVAL